MVTVEPSYANAHVAIEPLPGTHLHTQGEPHDHLPPVYQPETGHAPERLQTVLFEAGALGIKHLVYGADSYVLIGNRWWRINGLREVTMLDRELRAIADRRAAATPGPLTVHASLTWSGFAALEPLTSLDEPLFPVADAEFIAAAYTDVPKLLAEVARLRDLLQKADLLIEDLEDKDLASWRGES